MNDVVIVNDQLYGSERPYNALRLASAPSKRHETEVRVFLIGDAVACAVAGQQLQHGHYYLDRMLKGLLHRAQVGCCGTCLDARGLTGRPARRRGAALDARGAHQLDAVGRPDADLLMDVAECAALSRRSRGAVRRWRPLPAIARRPKAVATHAHGRRRLRDLERLTGLVVVSPPAQSA